MGSGKNKQERSNNFVPWLAGGFVAAVAIIGYAGNKPAEKPASVNAPSQLEERTQAIIAHDGVRIDVLASGTAGLQSGMKLYVDQYKRNQWMPYIPVSCEIPAIKYSSPLPIQDGMSSAKLTLSKPEQLVGKELYIVGEKNGRQVVLYKMQMGMGQ